MKNIGVSLLLLLSLCMINAFGVTAHSASGSSNVRRSAKVRNTVAAPPLNIGTYQLGGSGVTGQLSPTASVGQRLAASPADRPVVNSPSTDLDPLFGPGVDKLYFSSNATAVGTNGRLYISDPDNPPDRFHIWVTNLDGLSGQQLTGYTNIVSSRRDELTGDQRWPWVSQSGQLLTYSSRISSIDPYNVYVLNLVTNRRTQITGIPVAQGSNEHPTLNPAGTKVAFSSDRTGRYRLYRASTDGSLLEPITADGELGAVDYDDVDPSWSPDGRWIIFTRIQDDGETHIWIVNPEPNPQPQTSSRLTYYTSGGLVAEEMNPAWTLSGSSIVFTTTRKSKDGDGNLTIRMPATEVSPDEWDIYELSACVSGTNLTPEDVARQFEAISLTKDPTIDDEVVPCDDTYPTAGYTLAGSVDKIFAYQSDRVNPPDNLGETDIWVSLYNDAHAPVLLEIPGIFDETGTIPVREQTPGHTFMFRAKIQDAQTDVNKVYMQIKDPDGSQWDKEGKDHRIYWQAGQGYGMWPIQRVFDDIFVEIGQQAIIYDATQPLGDDNPRYSNDLLVFYRSMVDDDLLADAIQMLDDGPFSEGGHEPEGELAGDGTYWATWTSPPVASDFYVDIFTVDNWVNPYDDTEGPNQIIYDNITGFTTEPWNGANPVLLVGDYHAGQVFAQDMNFDPFLGSTRARPTWQPVESYWTDNPTGIFAQAHGLFDGDIGFEDPPIDPNEADPPWPDVNIYNGMHTLGRPGDDRTWYYTDIWRVQSRGPVPATVMESYLPRFDQQPNPVNPRLTRPVPVADRAVVWVAPYLGNLFTQNETLLNSNVQANVSNFLNNGGRMMLSGQDVAWALSHGRSEDSANTFLKTYFKVKYDSDTSNDVYLSYDGSRHELVWNDSVLITGPWGNVHRVPNLMGFPMMPPDRPDISPFNMYLFPRLSAYASGHPDDFEGIFIADPATFYAPPGALAVPMGPDERMRTSVLGTFPTPIMGVSNEGVPWCAAWNQTWLDTITPEPDANLAFGYATPNGGTTNVSGVYYEDPQKRFKTVFLGFGLEGLHDYFSEIIIPDENDPKNYPNGIDIIYQHSRRYQVMFNTMNWFLTCTLRGTVTVIDASNPGVKVPLANALVRMTNLNPKDNLNNGQITGTAWTDSNGNYVIYGVPSADLYQVDAIYPGTYIEHPQIVRNFYGGWTTQTLNFTVTSMPAGYLKGKVVTRLKNPVPNAVITAESSANSNIKRQATTDIEGIFEMDLPDGSWIITVNAGSEFAPGSIPESKTIVIQSGVRTDWSVNESNWFTVIPNPGQLEVTVVDEDGNPIENAQITVKYTGTGFTRTEGPFYSDAAGMYLFSDLDPGDWELTTTKSGYDTDIQSVLISTSSTTQVTVVLAEDITPGGIVRGRVVKSVDGAPIEGVIVEAWQNGSKICEKTTTGTLDPTYGTNFEFPIDEAPCKLLGAITLRLNLGTKPYRQPADLLVTVPSDSELLPRPVFRLQADNTLPSQLSLWSTPFDYTTLDPKAVLNGSSDFSAFTWNAATSKYQYYPSLPNSNRFVRGRGYFIKDTRAMAVTQEGTQSGADPYQIQLNPGWNLIGNPWRARIRWFTQDLVTPGVHVIDPEDSGNTLSMQEAINLGYIDNALWTEISGATQYSPYLESWTGYWIKAFEPLTLEVDSTPMPTAPVVASSAMNITTIGWDMPIIAETNGMVDNSTIIGVSNTATNGYDRLYDAIKPIPVSKKSLYVSLAHRDWGNRSGNYGFDIRSNKLSTQTWEIQVKITDVKGVVKLSWPEIKNMPSNVSFVLTDTRGRRVANLRTLSSYSFRANRPGTYVFKLTASGIK